MWNFSTISLIMTLKYGIVSQSTAVFSSVMKKKIPLYTVNRYNLEKKRDINFWSYRPALVETVYELH